ncbi:acetolactate synthase-1/2/3 large subunit [Thalassobacillus cyri]|uniref:Acetolactate synthase-1/2/3 large subunit n=1 Tax=Thalassobacillus cyri TaxID=571932 RepID=A0A1H3X5B2_9BACI|nr:thiamine pyrophosphate-binding protein [Thalassobacillus cyri]SDZ94577.1 acetolactate synthase-1/2/3 large subunit [Thalassobacillus cyri]
MKSSNQSALMTGAKGVVTCLKIEGITKVFCVPGESYLPVLDEIYEEPSMDLISARHEGGASFMAEGYAKASGKPGVVMATRGVGAANLSIGVHTAYQDSTPMVVFLGQVDSKFLGREGFQEVDLVQFFQPITKWAVEITHAERVPELIQRAFRIAQTGRPGPVVVSLPEDMLRTKQNMQFGPPVMKPAPAPSPKEIDALMDQLQQSKKPLIIAGGGVKHAKAEEKLLAFAEKNQLPVLSAFRRQDVFPNDHPLYVGHLGLGTNPKVLETVRQADVIMALGTRLSEVTTQDYSIISPAQTLIHIDITPSVLGKSFAPDLGIVADLKQALHALLPQQKTNPGWGDWIRERRQCYETASQMKIDHSTTITNNQVISCMQELLPANTVITNDAGNFAGWLHSYYQFKHKQTYVGPTSGAMGYGMPAALGVKLACPEKTVVSLSGDGGFMMTIQELETAVRYNIPIISIVFNNRMYGTIRMHQEIHFPRRVSGTELGSVQFSQIAKSIEADGFFVNSLEDFKYVLSKAVKNDRPTVIEVPMDQNQISAKRTIEDLRKH